MCQPDAAQEDADKNTKTPQLVILLERNNLKKRNQVEQLESERSNSNLLSMLSMESGPGERPRARMESSDGNLKFNGKAAQTSRTRGCTPDNCPLTTLRRSGCDWSKADNPRGEKISLTERKLIQSTLCSERLAL